LRQPADDEESAMFGLAFDTTLLGAFMFGGVLGWIVGEIIHRSKTIGVAHLGGIVGVVAGAAVTKMYQDESFGWYCIGLGISFTVNVLLKDKKIA
jgi:urea transporter